MKIIINESTIGGGRRFVKSVAFTGAPGIVIIRAPEA